MTQNNLHLIPEVILNLVDKFKTATHENEIYNMRLRLEATRDYLNNALAKKTTDSLAFQYMKTKNKRH